MVYKITLEDNDCILIGLHDDNLIFQLYQIDRETRELQPLYQTGFENLQINNINELLSSLNVKIDADDDRVERYIKKICSAGFGYKIGITMKNEVVRYSLYDVRTMVDVLKTESLERLKYGVCNTCVDLNL